MALITGVVPRGFGGRLNQDVWCNARKSAFDARDDKIKIVALQTGMDPNFSENFSSLCPDPRDTGGDEDAVDGTAVMEFYSETTFGRHLFFNSAGDGLADGISGALIYDEFPTPE